jgi:hypothetical protein
MSVCREEGFGVTLAEGNWSYYHSDPLQIKTYSTTYGHSIAMRAHVFYELCSVQRAVLNPDLITPDKAEGFRRSSKK